MRRIRANQVAQRALQIRRLSSAQPNMPLCPYNLAEELGLDVRFVNIPSFEGMYIADQNLILISSERPEGRKRFTCAHEIGHFALDHGTVIDEMLEQGSDKEIEKEADLFAGLLLVPKVAAESAFSRYGISPERLNAKEAYIISKYFGMSYGGFLQHLYSTLKLIDRGRHTELSRERLPGIRKTITEHEIGTQVIQLGDWWLEKAIDIEVGDLICSDTELQIEGPKILTSIGEEAWVYVAQSPGMARVSTASGWASYVKVSRSKFSGMLQYKYDEEVE